MPMSTYCSGSTTKNASDRGRRSPGRLGVSVMNSRSAKNDASANRTSVMVRPAQERHGEDRHHHPPGVDARVQVAAARGLLLVGRPARQQRRRSPEATPSKHHERAEQPEEFARDVVQVFDHAVRSEGDHRGPRALEKCFLRLAARSASGAPKRTVQTTGIGSSAPLGRLRCRLSRYTGTSSTCGNSPASRNRPLRNSRRRAPSRRACPRER